MTFHSGVLKTVAHKIEFTTGKSIVFNSFNFLNSFNF